MLSNYPNPFNGETTLQLSLERDSQVDVRLFDLTGRQLLHPISHKLTAGAHKLTLNLNAFESGVYLCKVSTGIENYMTKMTVIK